MADWEDIINNRLTRGRARWITYATNARRREEEEERRPGTRPSTGREGAQTSQIFTLGAPERGKFSENYVKGTE